jgi:hypothetical protein
VSYYCLTPNKQFPVEQELLTLPGHLISPLVFSGVQHLTYSRRDIEFEEFEDTKRAFRINPQIEGLHNDESKSRQTTINKTLRRKQKI